VVAHVVMFRPRAGLTHDERAALVTAFSRALRDIPGIRRAKIGRRVRHGRTYEHLMKEDYEFAAVLEFDDLRGLTQYLQDPAHEDLGKRFSESFETALIYDFEMSDGVSGLAGLA
jgi:Stress responsive A/B Barrel Domain